MRPMTSSRLVFAVLLMVSVACGGDDAGDDDPGADSGAAGGPDGGGPGGDPDAGAQPGEFVPLITGTWTIPAGDEIYHCARSTVDETMYISEFRPIIPLGTHHTVLTIDNPGTPDGEYGCSVIENGNKRGLYGTGVGANLFKLP